MRIFVERDSVCMGDDCDAPHRIEFSFSDDVTLDEVVRRMISSRYLASIAGGKATWILHGSSPLALIAQQWDAPHYFVDSQERAERYLDRGGERHLSFEYLQQQDPAEVRDAYEKSRLRS